MPVRWFMRLLLGVDGLALIRSTITQNRGTIYNLYYPPPMREAA